MRHKYNYVGAVVLSLLICGFIGGISISAASGNTINASGGNLLACYNTAPGGGSVKLNGHPIGNEGVLSVSSTDCPSGDTSAGLASYRRTILVSPNGTSTQNGTALLNAVTAAAGSSPGPTNGFLIKLEPGVYDLGNQSLVMPSYVDLEGSGQGITTVTSQVTPAPGGSPTGTLKAASNSEVRFITLANPGTNQIGSRAVQADQVDASSRFTYVTFSAPNGIGLGISQGGTPTVTNSLIDAFAGVENNGSGATFKDTTIKAVSKGITNGETSLTLDDVNLTVTCPPNATGMTETDGITGSKGTLTLLNSSITVQGCQASTAIASNYGFNAIIRNSVISSAVNDGNGIAYGVSASAGGGADIRSSSIKAVANDPATSAVKLSSSTVSIQNSTLEALGGSGLAVDTNGSATIQNSTLKGPANSINIINGSTGVVISAGSSQLDGTVTGTATFKCIFTYKGDYTPTTDTCQ